MSWKRLCQFMWNSKCCWNKFIIMYLRLAAYIVYNIEEEKLYFPNLNFCLHKCGTYFNNSIEWTYIYAIMIMVRKELLRCIEHWEECMQMYRPQECCTKLQHQRPSASKLAMCTCRSTAHMFLQDNKQYHSTLYISKRRFMVSDI